MSSHRTNVAYSKVDSYTPTNHAILDSGTTGNFIVVDAQYKNKQVASPGISVLIPDSSKITSSHMADLILPMIPHKAREGRIFSALKS